MDTKYTRLWLEKVVYKEEILEEYEVVENYDEILKCIRTYLEKILWDAPDEFVMNLPWVDRKVHGLKSTLNGVPDPNSRSFYLIKRVDWVLYILGKKSYDEISDSLKLLMFMKEDIDLEEIQQEEE
jgi:hypothetical protein